MVRFMDLQLRQWGCCLMGRQFYGLGNGNVLEVEGGDGYTPV
jgi:hypothetical protein